MKSIFASLLLISSVSFAAIDYVAIGETLRQVKQKVANTKNFTVCALKYYQEHQSCETIEILNTQFGKLLNPSYDHAHLDGCIMSVESIGYIRSDLSDVRERAANASPDDAILAVIEKAERSVEDLNTEVTEVVNKAKFQQTYVSQCMFGLEPEPVSIKDLICK